MLLWQIQKQMQSIKSKVKRMASSANNRYVQNRGFKKSICQILLLSLSETDFISVIHLKQPVN